MFAIRSARVRRGLLFSAMLMVIGVGFPVAAAAAGDTKECLMLLGKDGNYMFVRKNAHQVAVYCSRASRRTLLACR